MFAISELWLLQQRVTEASSVDVIYHITRTHNRSTALCRGLPGRVSSRRNIYPLTPVRKYKDLHRQQGPLRVRCFEPVRLVRPS